MKIVAKTGKEDVAMVYIAETDDGKQIEFVESVQPPLPRNKKWILTVSTLYGCPVSCRFCDAGAKYQGRLSYEEILYQIDYLIKDQFPNKNIPVEKFKIQFARMGEPSFNPDVNKVLNHLPQLYNAPGLLPSLSTIAPNGTDEFFNRLMEIKKKYYNHRFQFQYSIHTTDIKLRDWFIPVKTWSFEKMAEYGEAFYEEGDRKITLNFALANGMEIDPDQLLKYFNPDLFLIKITPLNPTYQSARNRISSIFFDKKKNEIVDALHSAGYEVISSLGDLEENLIGSNCGQYVTEHNNSLNNIKDGYTYTLQSI